MSASTILDPGAFGCIGVGVPFGIAASLACPGRPVLVATGEGSFGFNAIEVDTAVRHRAPVIIAVANNGAWQVEVYDQQVTHGRVVGTKLQFSDYAAMARAFGMPGERVEKPEELPGAVERAFANPPALLDVVVTPQAVSSDARMGLAWFPISSRWLPGMRRSVSGDRAKWTPCFPERISCVRAGKSRSEWDIRRDPGVAFMPRGDRVGGSAPAAQRRSSR